MTDAAGSQQIAVVGAGAMGRGIAQVAAIAGYEVTLFDAVEGAAERALGAIASGLEGSVSRGKLTPAAAELARSRVRVAATLSGVAAAELVIEAIVEDLAVKQGLFAELERVVSPTAVLASNTSSLSIGAIAAGMRDTDRLIGLHFFNPVPAMKLVEIILRPVTGRRTRETAVEFVERIGKTGVVVSDSPGFLVNLAGRAYVTEALAITRDGVATVEEVDSIAREVLGFPLGPFELMDLTGVDVNYPVTANLFEQNFGDPKLRSSWQHRYLLDSGNLGRKTGAGFYTYGEASGSAKVVDGAAGVAGAAEGAAAPSAPRIACLGTDALAALLEGAGIALGSATDADLLVVDPLGLDLHTYAAAHGLDPRRTVGIDTLIEQPSVLTLMALPGVDRDLVSGLARALESVAPAVLINDSPGFVAQRLLAAIVNLGTEIAQRGVATPEEIDRAVRLGLRYPMGPLEWGDEIGLDVVVRILDGMLASTGDSRYQATGWLARRASSGLSCLTEDFIPAARRNA